MTSPSQTPTADAEAALRAREQAALASAEHARHRLELLAAAGTVLSNSLDPQATLQAIASSIVPAVADWCRIDLVDADGELQRTLAHHSDPERSREGMALVQRLRAAPGTVGSMSWAVATGQSHLAHFDPPLAFDSIRDRDLLTFAHIIGMRAYFVVPLIARGRTLGALAALQAESGRPLTPDDCALVAELAQRAALALDNARLYAEAEAARRQAEAANRSKDEFLAVLGHELRNPLAPIVTALKLMELRGDASTAAERRIIERQVAHVSRLVDDLLDVSRIIQGKTGLQRARLDLRAVVERALEQTGPAMEKRSQPPVVALPVEPVPVWGDEIRLTQVLCNLLINAAKFTPPEGRIALSVVPSGAHVEVLVEDSGAGISAAMLPRVFDVFVQGGQGLDRRNGGLGLGLAIVNTLVRMHGGEVSAASEGEGRGCTFTVRLPLDASSGPVPARHDAASAPASSLPAGRTGRVLIVDDNADAALTLAELVGLAGYEVRAAHDGAEALEVAKDFRPELALLDIGLPGMSGYELAQRLRGMPALGPLRLVALTGYGEAHDRERALASAFDEHLVKPVPFDRLMDVMSALLGSPQGAAASTR